MAANEPFTPETAKAEIAALRRAASAGQWDLARTQRLDALEREIGEQERLAEEQANSALRDAWREARLHWEGLYAMTFADPPP